MQIRNHFKSLAQAMLLGVLLSAAVTAQAEIDEDIVIDQSTVEASAWVLSDDVQMLILLEGPLQVGDQRLHCRRTKLRGYELRKNYCQTAEEFAFEQRVRERLYELTGYSRGLSTRKFRNLRSVRFNYLPNVGSEGTYSPL